ncbi:MAG TPA: CheR family methyltransferase [Ilumatobacter sp.]|nr:CheR family methyltransferase [Ilumatobacter sp.]
MADTEEHDMRREADSSDLNSLLHYLREVRAFDFTGYKRATLQRRVDKRMQQLDLGSHDEYVDYLQVHPEEFEQLFNTILINVTSFFRDQDAWTALRALVPDIVNRARGRDIRVWSAGCASGQEAYSAVMMFAEQIGLPELDDRLKVYATDIDNEALEQARQATYALREVESLPADYIDKYFDSTPKGHTIKGELRRSVIFGRHDLLQDPPISRIDLLLCRNTLMYFNTDVQSQLVGRLHYSLADKGLLILGKVESLLGQHGLFDVVDAKQRVFSKVPRSSLRSGLMALGGPPFGVPYRSLGDEPNLAELAFEHHSTAQLLLDHADVLITANAQARSLFGLPTESIGRPFQDLEVSYRPVELRSSIDRARNERAAVTIREVERRDARGEVAYFDITIAPLEDDGQHFGVLLAFADTTAHRETHEELEQTHRELEAAYEELQSTNEELETTNEELQSTIEELETTNEELQSTNEELETMNEELSSTNEEFQAINEELRDRTAEFNQINAYMESVLKSIQVSVVVVDAGANVRVWNGLSYEMWGLRPEEVEGKSFLTLDIGFPVEALSGPIRTALAGKPESTVLEVKATSRRGHPLRCRATVNQLVGPGGTVDGAIILMQEFTPSE